MCGTPRKRRVESGDCQRRSLSPQPIDSGDARLAHPAPPHSLNVCEPETRLYCVPRLHKVKRPESFPLSDRSNSKLARLAKP